MKLIIEIPEEVYDSIRDKYENPNGEIVYDSVKKGMPYEEKPQGDLISREALLKAVEDERQYLLANGQTGAEHILVHHCLRFIYDAPTVRIDTNDIEYKAYCKGLEDGKKIARPQGEWIYKEFDVESGISRSYWCSNCGEPKSQWCDDFCQRCGADMRGAEND